MVFFLLAGQEINAELGSVSGSSDDDFFTSRIVRRRVFIQVSEGSHSVWFEVRTWLNLAAAFLALSSPENASVFDPS